MSAPDEFDRHRAQFFEMIGHCVTSYQFVEDLLENIFAAALGGPPKRASSIFAVVRGLEAKMDLVSAALSESDQCIRDEWSTFRGRIKEAARARDVVAHASVTHFGGEMVVEVSGSLDGPKRVISMGSPRMELRKRQKKDEIVVTIHDMVRQYVSCDKLFGHLVAFDMRLRGETPPPHLLEA